MKTRIVVRAIIQRGDEVLVNMTKRGPRLLGGRVKKTESLTDALTRELAEEVGLRVTVRDIAFVEERKKKSVRELTIVYRVHVFGDLNQIQSHEKGIDPRWVPRGKVVAWSRPIPFVSVA